MAILRFTFGFILFVVSLPLVAMPFEKSPIFRAANFLRIGQGQIQQYAFSTANGRITSPPSSVVMMDDLVIDFRALGEDASLTAAAMVAVDKPIRWEFSSPDSDTKILATGDWLFHVPAPQPPWSNGFFVLQGVKLELSHDKDPTRSSAKAWVQVNRTQWPLDPHDFWMALLAANANLTVGLELSNGILTIHYLIAPDGATLDHEASAKSIDRARIEGLRRANGQIEMTASGVHSGGLQLFKFTERPHLFDLLVVALAKRISLHAFFGPGTLDRLKLGIKLSPDVIPPTISVDNLHPFGVQLKYAEWQATTTDPVPAVLGSPLKELAVYKENLPLLLLLTR